MGRVVPVIFRQPGVLHRKAVAVADKLGTPVLTALGATQHDPILGSLLNGTNYQMAAVAGNRYGVSLASNILTVLTGGAPADYIIYFRVGQVAGADYYDIFLSVDAAPRWVGRITEAQRASGVSGIYAPGTTLAISIFPVVAGNMVVCLAGTGLQTSDAPFLQNTAYTPADPSIVTVACPGRMQVRVLVKVTITGFAVAPILTLIPFLQGQLTNEWYSGPLMTQPVLSAAGATLLREWDLDVEGAKALNVLVDTVTGCTVDIYCETV